jgi:HPr kinase/phosphorylase
MKFHQRCHDRAFELDFSPSVTEFGSMVDILGIGVLIRGTSGVGRTNASSA